MLGWSTLLGAILFAAFHVPLPQHRGTERVFATLAGRPARLLGISYHLLLLPAIAALPASPWARAAGLAWMLFDIVINGADYAGSTVNLGPLREGVHVLSALWLVVAGWTSGGILAAAGTALALVFLLRFLWSGSARPLPAWVKPLNAVLNVTWWVLVAVALW